MEDPVPSDGKYCFKIGIIPSKAKQHQSTLLYIDGKVPFDEARSLKMTKYTTDIRANSVFGTDITGNDLRHTKPKPRNGAPISPAIRRIHRSNL